MTKEACCWEKTTGIKNPLQISPIGFTGLTEGDFQYFEIAHFANHRNLQKEYLPLFKAITEKLQYLGKFCLERLTTVKQFKLTTSKSSGYGMLPYNLWFVLNHANRDKSGDAQLYLVLRGDSVEIGFGFGDPKWVGKNEEMENTQRIFDRNTKVKLSYYLNLLSKVVELGAKLRANWNTGLSGKDLSVNEFLCTKTPTVEFVYSKNEVIKLGPQFAERVLLHLTQLYPFTLFALEDYGFLGASDADLKFGAEHNEGFNSFKLHRLLECNRELSIMKKESARIEGRLYCEVCKINFQKEYGIEYIECHHRVPIYELKEVYKTKLSDLALVCPNCHLALHKMNLTVEELISEWENKHKSREQFA
jgi:hypothetical protein